MSRSMLVTSNIWRRFNVDTGDGFSMAQKGNLVAVGPYLSDLVPCLQTKSDFLVGRPSPLTIGPNDERLASSCQGLQ